MKKTKLLDEEYTFFLKNFKMPKNVKLETPWAFITSNLSQNIEKLRGPF